MCSLTLILLRFKICNSLRGEIKAYNLHWLVAAQVCPVLAGFNFLSPHASSLVFGKS